ncbi:hypothetical protein CEXT_812201 [Caerostris extrusa]|uniref:Uncharacterized protein n=1 Tax=Caerostris extrusa TaxID=172846 RepID=A0AAV4TG61_CAEEX|nr:hypothetical protein CEXT_812201 [Caerostris extrusa]
MYFPQPQVCGAYLGLPDLLFISLIHECAYLVHLFIHSSIHACSAFLSGLGFFAGRTFYPVRDRASALGAQLKKKAKTRGWYRETSPTDLRSKINAFICVVSQALP